MAVPDSLPPLTGMRDGTELALADLWCRILGISQVNRNDHFFELGATSFHLIELWTELQQSYGFQGFPGDLLENPTLAAMSRLLRSAAPHDRAQTCLVPICSAGLMPPVFCFHPLPGTVIRYSVLARAMDRSRVVYGLHARGLDPDAEPHRTIEEMATAYINEMLGVQPAGPFFLLGYSMGGLIAYEVAHQLRTAGHEIGMLGMIDTSPESTLGQSTEYAIPLLIRYGLRLDADIDEMLALDAGARNEKLLRMGIAAGTLPRDYGLPKLRRMLEQYEINGKAQALYRVRPLAETIILFRSREPGPPSLGWDRYVLEVVVVPSPGDHFQIMEPGPVAVIAQEVARRMSAPSTGALPTTAPR